MSSSVSEIKKAQKERLLLREISSLLLQAQQDDPELAHLSITRAELTPDKRTCYIFMFTDGGLEAYKKKLDRLKLYTPSLRKSLADRLRFRYVPDIKFRYDKQQEKQQEIHTLFEKLKDEGEL